MVVLLNLQNKNTSAFNHIVNFGSDSPQMANTKVL